MYISNTNILYLRIVTSIYLVAQIELLRVVLKNLLFLHIFPLYVVYYSIS